jgi:hypothetical protein
MLPGAAQVMTAACADAPHPQITANDKATTIRTEYFMTLLL